MSIGTKRHGFGRTNIKIIEVCGFCTNYGVEVSFTYAVALTEDQSMLICDLRHSPHHNYSVVIP